MRIILRRSGFHFVSSLNATQQQTRGEEPTERGKDTLKLPEVWGKIQQWLPKSRCNCSVFLLPNCHVTPWAFSIYINPHKHRDPNVPITGSTAWFSLLWGNTSWPHPCPSQLGGQNEQVFLLTLHLTFSSQSHSFTFTNSRIEGNKNQKFPFMRPPQELDRAYNNTRVRM